MDGTGGEKKPEPEQRKATADTPDTLWYYLNFATTLGWSIAVPVVAFVLAGRLLDKKFGTEPWMMLVAVILSIVVTTVIMVVQTRKVVADADARSRKLKEEK
ncbi:MAG: AtpZ/AtpI family protein [Candidatus Hydrogenedentes bacterium]|nr:AtpZ/AtpI family protein [Candidatus Hydrogenedentota bacterium]